MTKSPSMDNGRQHYIYLCMYIFIVLIEYQGWGIKDVRVVLLQSKI